MFCRAAIIGWDARYWTATARWHETTTMQCTKFNNSRARAIGDCKLYESLSNVCVYFQQLIVGKVTKEGNALLLLFAPCRDSFSRFDLGRISFHLQGSLHFHRFHPSLMKLRLFMFFLRAIIPWVPIPTVWIVATARAILLVRVFANFWTAATW